MQKFKFTKLLLASLLALTPFSATLRADNDKLNATGVTPARLRAVPIGTVESLGAVEINGSAAVQRGLLWNGDTIHSAPGASAQVLLASIGQLTLRGGSAIKLVADSAARTLYAAVLDGEMKVTLNPESSAKLEIGGTAFVTTKGAQFRASLRDGQPVVVAAAGRALKIGNYSLPFSLATGAMAQQQVVRRYTITPLNLGTTTEIRARATRNIQVRVTDENDRPVPDAPLLFLLSGGGGPGSAGSLAGQSSLQAVTNSQGVAQVNFNASDIVGSSTKIKVSVEGTNATWEGTITIIKAAAGFWAPQNAVPIFSVLGAAIGIGCYFVVTRDPIRQTPQVGVRSNGTVILP